MAEIERLVREDRLAEAIETLISLEVHKRTATLLASRLRRTQNGERQGVIAHSAADTEYTRIAQAILDLLAE